MGRLETLVIHYFDRKTVQFEHLPDMLQFFRITQAFIPFYLIDKRLSYFTVGLLLTPVNNKKDNTDGKGKKHQQLIHPLSM
jgi:hypothetical protein